MAGIEVNVLAEQCLDHRLPDHATLERDVAAREAERNAATRTITWPFTTADARVMLTHRYPVLED